VFVCKFGKIIEAVSEPYERWRIESNEVMNIEADPLLKIYDQVYERSPEAKSLFSRFVCASGLEDGVLVSTCWVLPSGVPDRYELRISKPSPETSQAEAVHDLLKLNVRFFRSGF
jgi:hypothetical protein